MANSLLDFVMSLVRDPDAAARYAADPTQAIADANLTGVTSADVSNLIPVVSESLSMGAPTAGADAAIDGNVWASGAATAAFDAFADAVPDHGFDDRRHHHRRDRSATGSVAGYGPGPRRRSGGRLRLDDPSSQFDGTVIDDVPAVGSGLRSRRPGGVAAAVGRRSEPDADAGFDIFS